MLSMASATWFEDIPRTIIQPNGRSINCYITGDQYARRLHDVEDYTIIMNPIDGYYYYAALDDDAELIPSELIVGDGHPRSFDLDPGYAISIDSYNRKKTFYSQGINQHASRDAPTSGEISQINVFIRFADDPEFTQPRSYYDAVFQTEQDEPSLRHYFWDVSYNNLLVNTFHYPGTFNGSNTAYVDEYNRSYYTPYSGANPDGYQSDTERAQREHTLLANAINSISASVSPIIDVDANADGFVDGVSFVIYGSPGDWADLLWPHRWALYGQDVYINGAQVYDYLFMLSESWYFNVGVLCHEFGHVLGAPDYYHYAGGGAPTPVGGWDVMASNGNPPQFPSAFTKWKYFDWIDMVEISQSGTYSLKPLQNQENTAYKIVSPNSDSEYFVLEYRKQEGMYDINAPGPRSGLVVYRINPEAGNGNAQGPPDELYVYRPGGDLNYTGNFDQAPYSASYGHTILNDETDPSSFLYNNGIGGAGGLNLFNVSDDGDSISFTVSFGPPIISVDPDVLTFELDAGEYSVQTITVSNEGEPESILNFSAEVTSADSYTYPQGGPDSGGYYWAMSDQEPTLGYEWIDISETAIQLEFSGNDVFASQDIDLFFDFPFYGESYSYLQVNANGWVGWDSENETAWENGSIPSADMPRPAIFAFFDDLNPNNNNGSSSSSGDIYYHTNDNRIVIWYDNVVRWGGSLGEGIYNFQLVLYSDGRIRCNYAEISGVSNAATIGWQNASGTEGTQLSSEGDAFAISGLSWEAKTYTDEDIPWLALSTDNGTLDGSVYGNQSVNLYVQALAMGLEEGNYNALINILSTDLTPVTVPVSMVVNGFDSIPRLPFIDISEAENGVVPLPGNVDSLFTAVANRYTHIVAPDGESIPLLIQDDFTLDQIIHVRKILESCLEDIPNSELGSDKTLIANSIVSTNAILFLLNNENEYSNPHLQALFDAGVIGQNLLATEVFPEGSIDYMNSTGRDVSYERVLHFIHTYGIQLAAPGIQSMINNAMEQAIEDEYYQPLSSLSADDYDERYFAMGLESYFGLWGHDPNGDGYCGEHEYAFDNRNAMLDGDPLLFDIVEGFFGSMWNYTATLPEYHEGNFYLFFVDSLFYTHRSQYLKNVSLSGTGLGSLYGNIYVNELSGNSGDNILKGFEGDDRINGGEGTDRAIYVGSREDYVIIPPHVTDDSSYQVIDLIPDRDGTDYLWEIEEIEFNGVVFHVGDLLENNIETVPNEFALFSPYPNPFNPKTRISFSTKNIGMIELNIYDINGRLVNELVNDKVDIGYYEIEWNPKDSNGNVISAGVYFVQLTDGIRTATQKVLLLK